MREKQKATLWILAIFLAGALSGGGLSFFWTRSHVLGAAPSERMERRSSGDTSHIVESLSRRLDLDPGQKQELRRIFQETSHAFRRLHEERRQQSEEIRRQTRQKIRSLLHPDQMARFEAFLKEHRRKYGRH